MQKYCSKRPMWQTFSTFPREVEEKEMLLEVGIAHRFDQYVAEWQIPCP